MNLFGEDEKLIISATIYYYYYSIYLHMLVRKHSNDFFRVQILHKFFSEVVKKLAVLTLLDSIIYTSVVERQ